VGVGVEDGVLLAGGKVGTELGATEELAEGRAEVGVLDAEGIVLLGV
jgi:hypothetical protein